MRSRCIDQEVARIAKRTIARTPRARRLRAVAAARPELEHALKAEIERMARVAKSAGLQPE